MASYLLDHDALFEIKPFQQHFDTMSQAAADLLASSVNAACDRTLLNYLTDYILDPASLVTMQEDNGEEMESLVRPTLEDEDMPEPQMSTLIAQLKDLLVTAGGGTMTTSKGAKQLDHIVNLSAFSSGASGVLPGSVDIASTTKARTTQVDLAKLEKAELKIKAKAEKRAKRTGMELYEGTKLLDASKKQKEYEELFMAINPLSSLGQAKGKSKDIHLVNIDVSFGSLRILTSGELTLAAGRVSTPACVSAAS